MILSSFRTQFKQKVFGDPTKTKPADSIIDHYINQAQRRFFLIVMEALNWTVNGEIATTNISAGQFEYPLPSGLMSVDEIKVDDITLKDSQYKIFDKSIILLDESLYEADADDALELTYREEYTDLVNDTDSTEFPSVFDEFIYKLASKEYCEDEEMWNKFNTLKEWCDKEVSVIQKHYSRKVNKRASFLPIDDLC